MNIRHAASDDVEEIHEVALISWKDTYRGIMTKEVIEEVVDEWYSTESLQDEVNDPVFYVAEKDSRIVGFVHATLENGKAKLHRIYLDPKHQRQGVGSALYKKAEEEIGEKAGKIELEVLAENRAGNSFYRSKGFEVKEEKEIELEGEKVQQKILVKKLE